jgi:hypothetical protein
MAYRNKKTNKQQKKKQKNHQIDCDDLLLGYG